MKAPIPTVELLPSPPDQFAIALRWMAGEEEFGTSQHVATTDNSGFPHLNGEQVRAIEKVIREYVEWVNSDE